MGSDHDLRIIYNMHFSLNLKQIFYFLSGTPDFAENINKSIFPITLTLKNKYKYIFPILYLYIFGLFEKGFEIPGESDSSSPVKKAHSNLLHAVLTAQLIIPRVMFDSKCYSCIYTSPYFRKSFR